MVDSKGLIVAFWWGFTVVAFVGFAGMGVVGLRDTIHMEQKTLVKVDRHEAPQDATTGHIAAAIHHASTKTGLSQSSVKGVGGAKHHHAKKSSKAAQKTAQKTLARLESGHQKSHANGVAAGPIAAAVVHHGSTKTGLSQRSMKGTESKSSSKAANSDPRDSVLESLGKKSILSPDTAAIALQNLFKDLSKRATLAAEKKTSMRTTKA